MAQVLLVTLNARYSHASMALRCLKANMGALRDHTQIVEFTLQQRPIDIAEHLLALKPRIIGLSVYIWNVQLTMELVGLLKTLAPEIKLVLGGPEVSHELDAQPWCQQADHLITGWGEVSFPKLVQQLLTGEPAPHQIRGEECALDQLVLPYDEYSDTDLAQRILYVEASRGCPFKCEFCLSSLDKTAKPFPLDAFLAAMDRLYQRGARQFKFIDRTFNLNIAASKRILEFFLERLDERLFVHFELIPDHLPDALREVIARFPPGQLQFEIGIQSFNPEVQQRISRKQNDLKANDNLSWLREYSGVHLHTDLIFGLPGEDLTSFAKGFNRLYALKPHEIQLGILKRLRGTPIIRHTDAFQLRFETQPPYSILSTDRVDFFTLQRVKRFARYWDKVANSGRFGHTLDFWLNADPFAEFMGFCDWLYTTTGQTQELPLDRLFDWLETYLREQNRYPLSQIHQVLSQDYQHSGARSLPRFMAKAAAAQTAATRQKGNERQQRRRSLADTALPSSSRIS